jgi:2'-5' RNA ligase
MEQKSIRVFLAAPLPEEIRTTLGKMQTRLRPLVKDLRCTRPEGIHLTLHFFGWIDPGDISKIADCVKKNVEGAAPFMLNLGAPGAFPSISRPRVLFIDLGGDTERLCRLQEKIEFDLEGIGYPVEKRAFTPHLTLGRLKEVKRMEGLPAILEKIKDLVAGGFAVENLVLYRSDLRPDGAVYTALETFPLGGQ